MFKYIGGMRLVHRALAANLVLHVQIILQHNMDAFYSESMLRSAHQHFCNTQSFVLPVDFHQYIEYKVSAPSYVCSF